MYRPHLSTFRLASPNRHVFVEAFLCQRRQVDDSFGSQCVHEDSSGSFVLSRRIPTLHGRYGLAAFAGLEAVAEEVGSTTFGSMQCGHMRNTAV